MAKGILGKKVGMTQIFSEAGTLIPVTVIEVTPNVVLQKKTVETDGYAAVQLGYCDKKEKLATKPETGHAKKANTAPKRFVKEIAGEEMLAFEVGQEVKGNIFTEGELVDVTGTSKGKGFAGVIKRYNFGRGPMAHGSGFHRGIGSMGAIDPARIKPGKKMPGRMGGETTTVQNLEFVKYDAENNVILVKGNVPGAKNSFVVITNAVKANKPELNPESLA
ncbi:MAG: 50S ribosomal protein L3 [Bacilli bacterium]|nr:50S ribosomal protein L3 [Bacilli bacterium]